MAKKLLLVGCGAMGQALVESWKRDYDLLIIDPSYPKAVKTLEEVSQYYQPDFIVLAVKPQMLGSILKNYTERFLNPSIIWISLAVGTPLSFLRQYIKTATLVKAMPNLAVRFKQGITALYSEKGGIPEVEEVFDKTGKFLWVENDEQVDKAAAISGSGPAYFYVLVEGLAKAAEGLGFTPEQAQSLARQTAIGAGQVLQYSAEDPATLRQNVTSLKGTTAAALDVLRDPEKGFEPLMIEAVQAAFRRSVEIAAELSASSKTF